VRRLAVVLALSAGCATVKMHHLEPDYDAVDKARIKRIAVVTSVASRVPNLPRQEPAEAVRRLWSLMARRYVNQKRDTFIAKKDVAGEPNEPGEGVDFFQPRSACEDTIDGVLWLDPKLARKGTGVEAQVRAQLLRCGDNAVIWEAQGAGSWPSEDEHLKETTAQYVSTFGPEVEPYVAPTFQLLKAVLDTLPVPADLTDEEKDEKISLDD
jgi:probable lipoprotein (TIGR04455 family)